MWYELLVSYKVRAIFVAASRHTIFAAYDRSRDATISLICGGRLNCMQILLVYVAVVKVCSCVTGLHVDPLRQAPAIFFSSSLLRQKSLSAAGFNTSSLSRCCPISSCHLNKIVAKILFWWRRLSQFSKEKTYDKIRIGFCLSSWQDRSCHDAEEIANGLMAVNPGDWINFNLWISHLFAKKHLALPNFHQTSGKDRHSFWREWSWRGFNPRVGGHSSFICSHVAHQRTGTLLVKAPYSGETPIWNPTGWIISNSHPFMAG
jgi:hypothetical protein